MLGIELEQTRVYREAEQKGELKGELREGQSLVLRQLNRRVGNVFVELQERVKALPQAQLEDLGEALLDFNSSGDLEAWLER